MHDPCSRRPVEKNSDRPASPTRSAFAMVTIPSYFTSAHRTRILSKVPRPEPCVSRCSFLLHTLLSHGKFLDTALLDYRDLIIRGTDTSCKTSGGYLARRSEGRGNCARLSPHQQRALRNHVRVPTTSINFFRTYRSTFLAHGRHASLLSLPFLVLPRPFSALLSTRPFCRPFSTFSLTSSFRISATVSAGLIAVSMRLGSSFSSAFSRKRDRIYPVAIL